MQSGPLAPRHIWSLARLDRIWTLMLQGKEKASSSRERVKRLRDSSPEELLHLAHTVAKVSPYTVVLH